MAYPVRMRGRDEDTGEFLSPSRSAQRRAALDVLALGERLVALTPAQLGNLPIPEQLLTPIRETQRIPSHGARKRQSSTIIPALRYSAYISKLSIHFTTKLRQIIDAGI